MTWRATVLCWCGVSLLAVGAIVAIPSVIVMVLAVSLISKATSEKHDS
jgi:hypothetical protein